MRLRALHLTPANAISQFNYFANGERRNEVSSESFRACLEVQRNGIILILSDNKNWLYVI